MVFNHLNDYDIDKIIVLGLSDDINVSHEVTSDSSVCSSYNESIAGSNPVYAT